MAIGSEEKAHQIFILWNCNTEMVRCNTVKQTQTIRVLRNSVQSIKTDVETHIVETG